MLIRILLIALAVVVVVYLVRRAAPHIARNPRLGYLLMGLGRNVFFIYLIRRAIPVILRALSSLRLFR